MSLVGPRPCLPSQKVLVAQRSARGVLRVRPGITGLWQTAGRNRTTFEARAEYDTQYEAELSLLNDARILARTVGVVMNATGC